MEQERGSVKMLRERLGAHPHVQDKHLELFSRVAQIENTALKKILTRGIPPVLEYVGTYHTTPQSLGHVVGPLTQYGGHLRLFPYGIPVIDEIAVEFEIPAEALHAQTLHQG